MYYLLWLEGRPLALVACESTCYMHRSNLSEDKDYHDQGFSWFSSVPSGGNKGSTFQIDDGHFLKKLHPR